MDDSWRQLLYYPLGLAPAIFFTLRVLVQWIQSEKRKQSYTGKSFWRLSLAGNLLLMLHYLVQVQFPFAMLQASNGVISFRNLDLMKKRKRLTTRQTIVVLIGTFALVTILFLFQSYFIIGEMDWIRTPTKLFDTQRSRHSLLWHVIGSIGGVLFASRFWIQWWSAEVHKKSELGKSFWWISIVGSSISLVYFFHIRDTVSILHYSFTLIPYFRNLVLIRRLEAS